MQPRLSCATTAYHRLQVDAKLDMTEDPNFNGAINDAYEINQKRKDGDVKYPARMRLGARNVKTKRNSACDLQAHNGNRIGSARRVVLIHRKRTVSRTEASMPADRGISMHALSVYQSSGWNCIKEKRGTAGYSHWQWVVE